MTVDSPTHVDGVTLFVNPGKTMTFAGPARTWRGSTVFRMSGIPRWPSSSWHASRTSSANPGCSVRLRRDGCWS